MSNKILEVVEKIERIRFPNGLFISSTDQLTKDYPELIYANASNGIYHDLEKKATPHGIKNSLKFEMSLLRPLIDEELRFLVRVRNAIKKILCVVKAARNKKFILSILEFMFKTTFSTGGGTSPGVRRIIMIYEREGGVQKNKRKVDEYPLEEDDDESLEYVEEEEIIIPVPMEQNKKVKNLVVVQTPALEPVMPMHEWLTMFEIKTETEAFFGSCAFEYGCEEDLQVWNAAEVQTMPLI